MNDFNTRVLTSLRLIGRPVTPQELRERGQIRQAPELVKMALDSLVAQGMAMQINGSYTVVGTQAKYPAAPAPPAPPAKPKPAPTPAPAPKPSPSPQPAPIQERIYAALRNGPLPPAKIREAADLTRKQADSNLHRMRARGLLKRDEEGRYSIPPHGEHPPESRWSAEEDAILRRGASLHDTLQMLAEMGSRRTGKAVVERMKRLTAMERENEPKPAPEPEPTPEPEEEKPMTFPSVDSSESTRPDDDGLTNRAHELNWAPELTTLRERLKTPAVTIERREEKMAWLKQLVDLMRDEWPVTAALLDEVRVDLEKLG